MLNVNHTFNSVIIIVFISSIISVNFKCDVIFISVILLL